MDRCLNLYIYIHTYQSVSRREWRSPPPPPSAESGRVRWLVPRDTSSSSSSQICAQIWHQEPPISTLIDNMIIVILYYLWSVCYKHKSALSRVRHIPGQRLSIFGVVFDVMAYRKQIRVQLCIIATQVNYRKYGYYNYTANTTNDSPVT